MYCPHWRVSLDPTPIKSIIILIAFCWMVWLRRHIHTVLHCIWWRSSNLWTWAYETFCLVREHAQHTQEEGVSKEECEMCIILSRASFCKTQTDSLLPFFLIFGCFWSELLTARPFIVSMHARPRLTVPIDGFVTYTVALARSIFRNLWY